jgi:tRNA1Val (adenine37-N6)-methyltransferase
MFRFKQFTISDEKSTMKVGTDALLLSALSPKPETGNILDIGTGCGVIALLHAQISNCHIDAIDIDEQSVIEARINFANSPWHTRISAFNSSLQDYLNMSIKKYELIVSNPPFFVKSMKGENSRRNLARHSDSLSLEDLFAGARKLISESGKCCVILPADLLQKATTYALQHGFFLNKLTEIITKQGKSSTRSVLTFTLTQACFISDKIIISDSENQYSQQYRELMKPFLTIF